MDIEQACRQGIMEGQIEFRLLQLNEVKLSYYGVAIHLLSGFWSVFRAETSLTH